VIRYMVWYGMVWYGMVYDLVYDMVWYGMVKYATILTGVVRCYNNTTQVLPVCYHDNHQNSDTYIINTFLDQQFKMMMVHQCLENICHFRKSSNPCQ
jgi:hypothetical protein